MPNHGVASGAGSTASTLGPRQEWGNGYALLVHLTVGVRGYTNSTSPPILTSGFDFSPLSSAVAAGNGETGCDLINSQPCSLIYKVTGGSFVCTSMYADLPRLVLLPTGLLCCDMTSQNKEGRLFNCLTTWGAL